MARCRTGPLRQLGKGDEPGPVILAGPARHRQPAIAVLADWDARRGDKADRAVDIGVDDVLLRADKIGERVAKSRPVVGAVDVPKRLGGAILSVEKTRLQRQDIAALDAAFGQHVRQDWAMP